MNGRSFSLIPWRAQILDGRLPQWEDAAIAILPVLAAHEDFMLKAWPSQNTIAALAGISKTSVGKGLDFLAAQKWISIELWRETRSARYVYTMSYPHYTKGSHSGAFMSIPRILITNVSSRTTTMLTNT